MLNSAVQVHPSENYRGSRLKARVVLAHVVRVPGINSLPSCSCFVFFHMCRSIVTVVSSLAVTPHLHRYHRMKVIVRHSAFSLILRHSLHCCCAFLFSIQRKFCTLGERNMP